MGETMLRRLESYFLLSPSPGGLILPPDPFEQNQASIFHGDGSPARRAAVLIPVVYTPDGRDSQIMLTRRTAHLRSHPGQISLPGGSVEPEDRDLIHTALREAEEETCLPAHAVKVIGTLPALLMSTAFHVTPVVGLVDADTPVAACPEEVAEIFYVPTTVLLNPDNYRISSMMFQNRERKFRELIYQDYRIWGATAAILHHLAEQIHS